MRVSSLCISYKASYSLSRDTKRGFLFVSDYRVATRKARFFSPAGKATRKGKCGMQKE